jgi:hypothetical protein
MKQTKLSDKLKPMFESVAAGVNLELSPKIHSKPMITGEVKYWKGYYE